MGSIYVCGKNVETLGINLCSFSILIEAKCFSEASPVTFLLLFNLRY